MAEEACLWIIRVWARIARIARPLLRSDAFARLNRWFTISLTLFASFLGRSVSAQSIFFQDDFAGNLGPGWTWRREHREAWRITPRGLEIQIEPGNMWGPANDAKNILLHPLPGKRDLELEISVRFEHRPTEQYEQTDLVWYYDDSHMVKIGEELVDGKLSVVMGREEKDRTRTLAIVPLKTEAVELRLISRLDRIRGEYRPAGETAWKKAGECDLPMPASKVVPQISIQTYQGPAHAVHWATISDFLITEK